MRVWRDVLSQIFLGLAIRVGTPDFSAWLLGLREKQLRGDSR